MRSSGEHFSMAMKDEKLPRDQRITSTLTPSSWKNRVGTSLRRRNPRRHINGWLTRRTESRTERRKTRDTPSAISGQTYTRRTRLALRTLSLVTGQVTSGVAGGSVRGSSLSAHAMADPFRLKPAGATEIAIGRQWRSAHNEQ